MPLFGSRWIAMAVLFGACDGTQTDCKAIQSTAKHTGCDAGQACTLKCSEQKVTAGSAGSVELTCAANKWVTGGSEYDLAKFKCKGCKAVNNYIEVFSDGFSHCQVYSKGNVFCDVANNFVWDNQPVYNAGHINICRECVGASKYIKVEGAVRTCQVTSKNQAVKAADCAGGNLAWEAGANLGQQHTAKVCEVCKGPNKYIQIDEHGKRECMKESANINPNHCQFDYLYVWKGDAKFGQNVVRECEHVANALRDALTRLEGKLPTTGKAATKEEVEELLKKSQEEMTGKLPTTGKAATKEEVEELLKKSQEEMTTLLHDLTGITSASLEGANPISLKKMLTPLTDALPADGETDPHAKKVATLKDVKNELRSLKDALAADGTLLKSLAAMKQTQDEMKAEMKTLLGQGRNPIWSALLPTTVTAAHLGYSIWHDKNAAAQDAPGAEGNGEIAVSTTTFLITALIMGSVLLMMIRSRRASQGKLQAQVELADVPSMP